ncbi:MAG: hypothetical protein J1E02_07590 [Coprobacter sp.]|nr:hypothetical protein [Coprobacter sp.]
MGKLELIRENEVVSMYSPLFSGESRTEFHQFLTANKSLTHPQLKAFFDNIVAVIRKMDSCGARENLFRPEGGRVKAIPLVISYRTDKRIGKMRLYCLRLSDRLLILGNGGVTTKQKYQDDPHMLKAVEDLRQVDRLLKKEVKRQRADWNDFNTIKSIIETITI